MKRIVFALALVFAFSVGVLTACDDTPPTPPPPTEVIYTVTVDGAEKQILENERVPLFDLADTDERIFLGWSVDGVDFDPMTRVTSDLVITSKWRDRYTYTVTFDGEPVSVTEGFPVTAPDAPVGEEGYEFAGWFVDGIPFDASLPVYRSFDVTSRWIEEKQAFDYSAVEFTDLGTVGGDKAPLWSVGIARDAEYIHYFFCSEQDVLPGDIVCLYLQVGEVKKAVRDYDAFAFVPSVSGELIVYYYPANVKTKILSGQNELKNGCSITVDVSGGKSTIYGSIPYAFFAEFNPSLPLAPTDVFGISLTADGKLSGGYDTWSRADLPGADGKAHVDRMNMYDHVRVSKDGTIFEASTNEFDTFLSGNVGIGGVTVSVDGKTLTTDERGEWSYWTLRGEKTGYDVTYTHAAYQDKTISFELGKPVIYTDTTVLESKLVTLGGKLVDYATGEAVSGATVTYGNGKTATTDATGAFTMSDVAIAEELTLTVEKTGYESASKTFTSAQMLESGFVASISVIGNATQFTLKGKAVDATGAGVSGATVSTAGSVATTDAQGNYELTVDYADTVLTFAADGFLTGASTTVAKSELLQGENFVCELASVELTREYMTLYDYDIAEFKEHFPTASLAVPYNWTISGTRTSEALLLRMHSDDDVDLTKLNNATLFLHFGEASSHTRSATTVSVVLTASDPNSLAVTSYWPGNKKTTITHTGITTTVSTTSGVTVDSIVPYGVFTKYYSVTSATPIRVSMTLEHNTISGYVCMYDYEHVGLEGTVEVEREYPKDWPTWTAQNTFEYIHEYDSASEFEALANAKLGVTDFSLASLATFTVSAGSLQTVKVGGSVFTDRVKDFLFTEGTPEFMLGLTYNYSSIAGVTMTVTESGYALVVAPYAVNDANGYLTQKSKLLESGWTLVLEGYSRTYGTRGLEYNNYYVKTVTKGETYKLGKWNFWLSSATA